MSEIDWNSKSTPLVSVIIPSYNTARTVGRAIESVAETNYPRLEVIIVDDGSRDDSIEEIKRYQARFPWVTLLTHPDQKNHGIAATRNLAIQKSSGRYVTFLDADDTFLPNRFDAAIPLLESDPAINVIYEPYRLVHVSGSRADAIQTNATESIRTGLDDEQLFLDVLQHGGFPHTTSVTVRRSALMDTGLFPPLLYCLEKPLWLKLYCQGGIRPGASSPVACYYLHEQSTCAKHEGTAAFRFEDVLAHLDVYRWMRQRGIQGPKREAIEQRAFGKYLHYTTYARSMEHRFGRDVVGSAMAMILAMPQVALRMKFWKATVAMLGSRRRQLA